MTVPRGVADGRVVAVVVALADGRDGPPQVIDVPDLEARDVGVRHREVHEGQDSGALPRIEATRGGHRAGDRVPVARALEPEARDLSLVLGAQRADLAADVL